MDKSDQRSLPAELQALLPRPLWDECIWVAAVKGERLFLQGNKPEQMFYVSSGEVVLQRAGLQGENIVLQRARQSFIAEASLQSSAYHCDAMVTVSGEVIAIPAAMLTQALLSDAAFSMRWIGMLNRELRRMRMQCERLSLKGVRDRLLHLIETEGQVGSLPLGAGLKNIALEIGVTHEALYRAVADMEKQGVLRRADGQITLL